MFQHVAVLLSFVFAIALTHLFTSTTELIWARARVRFSWLQALWMFNALVGLLIGWIGMFYLSTQPHWDMPEVLINFAGATAQYFSCSLISIRPSEEGVVDMPAFFERQRPYIMAAFLAMMLVGLFENWWDRSLLPEWLYAEAQVIPMIVFVAAGFARASWLQWTGGIGLAAVQVYFLFASILN